MFGWFKVAAPQESLPLFFFNTANGTKEQFHPRGKIVRMYNCGPTVYDYQHIGNLSAAVFADTIRRVLEFNGYEVKQVINITDFGHLVSDGDEGEDKMTKGLKREKLELTMQNMMSLADRYTAAYMEDIAMLGVAIEKIEFPRASHYIDAQIALIKTLDEKGYVYRLADGLYFETKSFPRYGSLGGINLEELKGGARVAANPEKHSPADFALWKFSESFGWESPWGKGFPGWHIECSAMARAVLGEQIDIHTGGVEHIAIHHNNEIAQSEAATGKSPLARYWMHRAHIQMEGHKIAKSEGNTVYLTDIIEKNFHPLALRYWFLTAHYRTPANFTWPALSGSYVAFLRLHRIAYDMRSAAPAAPSPAWIAKFKERINDDLDTPGAIAFMWEMLKKTGLSPGEKYATLMEMNRALALGLGTPDEKIRALLEGKAIPAEDLELKKKRDEARQNSDWALADKLRDDLVARGYDVRDTDGSTIIVRAVKKATE